MFLLSGILLRHSQVPASGRFETIRYIDPQHFDFRKIPGRYQDFPIWVTDGESQSDLIKEVQWALKCSVVTHDGKFIFYRTKADDAALDDVSLSTYANAIEAFKKTPQYLSNITPVNWQERAGALSLRLQDYVKKSTAFYASLKHMSNSEISSVHNPLPPLIPTDYTPLQHALYKFLDDNTAKNIAALVLHSPTFISDQSGFTSDKVKPISVKLSNHYWASFSAFNQAAKAYNTAKWIQRVMPTYAPAFDQYDQNTEGLEVYQLGTHFGQIFIAGDSFTAAHGMLETGVVNIPLIDPANAPVPGSLQSVQILLGADDVSALAFLKSITGTNSDPGTGKVLPLPQVNTELLISGPAGDVSNHLLHLAIPALAAALGDTQIHALVPDSSLRPLLPAVQGNRLNIEAFYKGLMRTCEITSQNRTLTIFPLDVESDVESEINRQSLNNFVQISHNVAHDNFNALATLCQDESPLSLDSLYARVALSTQDPNINFDESFYSSKIGPSMEILELFLENNGSGSSSATFPSNELPRDWRRCIAEQAGLMTLNLFTAPSDSGASQFNEYRELLTEITDMEDSGDFSMSVNKIFKETPVFFDKQGKQVTVGWSGLNPILPTDPHYPGTLAQYIDENYTVGIQLVEGYQGTCILQDGTKFPITAAIQYMQGNREKLSGLPDMQEKVIEELTPEWQMIQEGKLVIRNNP